MTASIDRNRRGLLCAVFGVAVCPMFACGESATPSAPAPEFADDAATVRGTVVEIDLTRVPQWRSAPAADSAVVFLAAQVIVVRRPLEQYTAFSAVCPHAGCGVSTVLSQELVCPCHGSAFDFAGARLSGPAPSGLTQLAVMHDTANRRLMIQRVSA